MYVPNEPTKISRIEISKARAKLYSDIRCFFLAREILEVETPIFSHFANTDPSICSLQTDISLSANKQELLYAHTSPEIQMKRLLVEEFGSIFQICKVFRLNEDGRLHNPEFTMLEWYRQDYSYYQLMDELTELLVILNLCSECQTISYASLFEDVLEVDIFNSSTETLIRCAEDNKLDVRGLSDDFNSWCDLLMSHLIEPNLGHSNPVFVVDYPPSQSALSKITSIEPKVAQRFELYIRGVEMANGYQELTTQSDYERCFKNENKIRQERHLPQMPYNVEFLQSMTKDLNEYAGVAVGLDRLLMHLLRVNNIQDVLLFPVGSA